MSRLQTIENVTSVPAAMGVDGSIALWDKVATQIILLVGEAGFESLYARSVFLSKSQFPWLALSAVTSQPDHRFKSLAASLLAQPPALANEANRALLITFTDILASLVGESLTASILESAWGCGSQSTVGKEQKDER